MKSSIDHGKTEGKVHNLRPALRARIAICGSILLLGQVLWAQEGRAPVSITLGDAINTALGGNLGLQQSANQVESSRYGVEQSKGVFMPDLSAKASVYTRAGKAYDPVTDSASDHNSHGVDTNLQSTTVLFDGLGNKAGLDRAKAVLEAGRHDYARAQDTTAYTAAAQFLTALMQGELVKTRAKDLDAQAAQLEQIEMFFEYGKKPISDVLQQRSDISQAELDLLKAKQTFELAKMDLLQTMGVMASSTVDLAPVDREGLVERIMNNVRPEELPAALERRADYQARKLQVEASRQQVAGAQSSYYPTVSLNLAAGTQYNSDNEALTYSEQYYDVNPYGRASVNLTVPIYDKSQTHGQVGQAKVAQSTQEIQLRDLEQQIWREDRQARIEYETAMNARRSALAQSESADEALKATQARYDLGFVTYVELSQARAVQLAAANNLINAEYDIIVKGLAVMYQQGRMSEALDLLGEGPAQVAPLPDAGQ